MTMRRLIREPLVHFFLIGSVLFLIYDFVDTTPTQPEEIIVNEERLAAIRARFEQTWKRPPTASELEGLIDQWVREELLYREGVALGLDRDDPVIRRRVAQKMGFMAEALSSDLPDDAELAAWLRDNPERYREPDRYTLRQVYLDPARHDGSLDQAVRDVRNAVAGGADWRDLGDRTLLPARLEDVDRVRIATIFGAGFARALAGVTAETWAGPLESGYGVHLVYVESYEKGELPSFDEIRAKLEQDYLQAQAERAERELIAALRDRYEIRIETDARGQGGADE